MDQKVAVVMAGGLGSRLRPLTANTPKCLLPVCGVPLLDRIVAQLTREGVDDIIVVTNHLAALVKRHVQQLAAGYPVRTVPGRPEGPSGDPGPDLVHVAGQLRCERLLVLNANCLVRVPVDDMFGSAGSARAVVALVRQPGGAGKYKVDADGYVVGIDGAADTLELAAPSPTIIAWRGTSTGWTVVDRQALLDVSVAFGSFKRHTLPLFASRRSLVAHDLGVRPLHIISTSDSYAAANFAYDEIRTSFPVTAGRSRAV